MAALAFVLLAHEPAHLVATTVEALLRADQDCFVAVHYDGNSPTDEFVKLRNRFSASSRVLVVHKRTRCGWGQFGLVEGALKALNLLEDEQVPYTHAYLVSGSCWPIRSLEELRNFLDAHSGLDFIESHNEQWITGGLRKERYTLRHPFGFARHRKLFEGSVWLQRKLGLKRRLPKGIEPRYGSQWWCLRRSTIVRVLQWVKDNPGAYGYYRYVWIPDETFFQSVIHTFADVRVSGDYILTLYRFNAFGKPIVFYDDHLSLLERQPYFFARKIAPAARHAREALLQRAASPPTSDNAITSIPDIPDRKAIFGEKPVPRFGQIFEPNSGVRNWTKNLKVMRKPCGVLYGPPDLVSHARKTLGDAAGDIVLLGRLFRKDKIEFEPHSSEFRGLQSEDVTLRDYDRALFLSRIIERADQFPFFMLCPGDDPFLEKHVLASKVLIGLPIVPGGCNRDMFWYMALPEDIRNEIDNTEGEGHMDLMEERIRQVFGRRHVTNVDRKLFHAGRPEGCETPLSPDRRAALHETYGDSILPFFRTSDRLADIISAQQLPVFPRSAFH